jgi:hypothetical protein
MSKLSGVLLVAVLKNSDTPAKRLVPTRANEPFE